MELAGDDMESMFSGAGALQKFLMSILVCGNTCSPVVPDFWTTT